MYLYIFFILRITILFSERTDFFIIILLAQLHKKHEKKLKLFKTKLKMKSN